VLLLLLLDVVFCLLHVHKNLFELLVLLILLGKDTSTLDELPDLKVRLRKRLNLEIDDCAAYLHGLSQ